MPLLTQDIGNTSHLLPPFWKEQVQLWFKEDVPSFDVGGYVVGETQETAFLLGKSPGILAGSPFFDEIFSMLGCQVEWILPEGSVIEPGKEDSHKVLVAKVSGKCRNILLGERLALNILTRASGIATQAKRCVDICKQAGWNGEVSGTRKTTPGFRLVEKYSLLVAGASTHRQDLSQMVMIKDNHVWATGSVSKAVRKAKNVAGFSIKIEVECQSIHEAMEAAEAGADIVMLDNFSPKDLCQVAEALKNKYPNLLIEASGGICEDTLEEYLSPHIDIISQGRFTQGYDCLDFSLKIQTVESIQHN